MDRRKFKNIQKKHFKALSFCAAFLIHFALVAALFWPSHKKNTQPEFTLEVVLLKSGKPHSEKSIAEIHKLDKKPQKDSQHYHIHSEEGSSSSDTELRPIFNPLPQIPDHLRSEAFSSRVLARFHIRKTGDISKVELVEPSNNPRLNILLLKSLKKWKFPATGSDSTQEIRVTFSVG